MNNAVVNNILLRIILVMIPVVLHAQQQKIDSLKSQISHTNTPQIKLQLLDTLCGKLLYNGDKNENEVFYFTKMHDLAIKLNKPKKQHKALKYLANHYLHQSNFTQAEKYALQTLQVATNKQLNVESLFSHSLLGRIYNRFDFYDQAIANYQFSIKIYTNKLTKEERKNHLNFMSTLYANMAIVYRNTQNDSLTDLYNIKSFELAKKAKDYMRISHFYATQAWVYVNIENYPQAENYFQKALQDSAKIKIKIYNIAAQHGLGFTYANWGKYDKAIQYNKRVLAYFIKTKNNTFISSVSHKLSYVYLQLGDYKQALTYANQSLKIAQQINSPKHIINAKLGLSQLFLNQKDFKKATYFLKEVTEDTLLFKHLVWKQKTQLYEALAKIAQSKNDFKKAYKYQNLLNTVKDSIHQRRLSNFSDFDTKYQNEKKRKEILLKEKELEIQKNKKEQLLLYLSILGLLGAILTTFFTRYYIRNKQYKAELKDTLLEIKKIKTQLFSVDNLQSKQSLEFNQKEFKNFLKKRYRIEKNEIIDVWESISNGISRNEYAKKTKINENTIKSWRNELYTILKKATFVTGRYSDYKAVVTYYDNLRIYEAITTIKP